MLNRREVLVAGGLLTASYAAYGDAAPTASIYPLKPTRGDRLLLAARINGHPVDALLDSAAEASFVDRQFAVRIGLVGAETVTAKGSGKKNFAADLAYGVTLEAAGLTLREQTVAVADLADVGRRLLGHPLDMVLGRELFDAARLRIDIRGRELEVVDPTTTPRGQRLELRTVNGIEVFNVRVEGEAALAALDLGNGSNVLVGSEYAQRRGWLTDGRSVSKEEGGGLGGATTRSVIALKTLELGGVTLSDVAASIDEGDSATDLNVGISVLRNFVITTDFRAHTLWLAP